MHRDYGARPNSIHVIGRDGIVLFRVDWNDPEKLKVQLARLMENNGEASGLEAVDLADNFTAINAGAVDTARRVLIRAGYAAVLDVGVSSMNLFRGRAVARP